MSYNRLSILEAVNQCSYNSNIKDYITNIIYELCTQSKSARYYKCNRVIGNSSETIIVIRYIINTKFVNRFYEIPILIYIPSIFPYAPPEIYLERTSKNIAINEKNRDIDAKTNRITTKEILNWNSYSTLPNVISEINISFNIAFPIYQITNHRNLSSNRSNSTDKAYSNTMINNMQINQNAQNFQNTQNANLISQNINLIYQQYNNQQQQNSNVNIGPIDNKNLNQYYNNFSPVNTNVNNQFSNISLNDKSNQCELAIKSILIEDIKKQVYKPISEEMRRLTREKEKLNNYKNVFINLIKRYKEYLIKRDDIIPYLESLIQHLDSNYFSIKGEVDSQMHTTISKKNCFEMVSVNNQNLLNFIAMEATIEDSLNIIKKGFERHIISFSECIRYIRIFSREIIKIKIAREKMLKY
jgi:hypothetical protein